MARAEFESLHSRPLDDLQTTLSQKSSCLYFLFLESLLFLSSVCRCPRAEEAVTQHSCFFTLFRSLKYELPLLFNSLHDPAASPRHRHSRPLGITHQTDYKLVLCIFICFGFINPSSFLEYTKCAWISFIFPHCAIHG